MRAPLQPSRSAAGAAADAEAAAVAAAASSSSSNPEFAPLPPSTPASQVEMVGVVQELDLQAQRVTIAYEAAPLLNLPAWTMPFPVAKPDLLNGVTVGQKVRFKVDSHQIYALQPF